MSTPKAPEDRSVVANQIAASWPWALVILVAGIIFVAQFSARPNIGFKDGAAVLAMVSLVAIGIERIIEMMWSAVTAFRNGWWPLGEIADAIDSVVAETNKTVEPAFTAAFAHLAAVRKAAEGDKKRLEAIDAEVDKVRAQQAEFERQVTRIQKLGKDNQQVQLVATTAFQAVHRLDTAYGALSNEVRKAFNDASQVATGVSDLLAGFKDNPAKKILSLYVGAVIGLIVAGFIGLDLFAAAGAPLTIGRFHVFGTDWLPYVGVAVTGIVVGLGANPTHQVVSYVTEAAKARKARSIGRPEVLLSGAEGVAAVVVDEAERPAARVRPGSMNLRD